MRRAVARVGWIALLTVAFSVTPAEFATPANAAYPATIGIDGCEGAENFMAVPSSRAREFVPPEFRFDGFGSNEATIAYFHYHAFKCATVQLGATVLHDQSYLEFAVSVKPTNPDWSVTGFEYYLIEVLVSSPVWAGYLQANGIAARVAEFDQVELPGLVSSSENLWTVSNADSSFTLDFPMLDVEPFGTDSYGYSVWTGAGPFTRIFNDVVLIGTTIQDGVLLSQGPSDGAVAAGPILVGDSAGYKSWKGSWTWEPGAVV